MIEWTYIDERKPEYSEDIFAWVNGSAEVCNPIFNQDGEYIGVVKKGCSNLEYATYWSNIDKPKNKYNVCLNAEFSKLGETTENIERAIEWMNEIREREEIEKELENAKARANELFVDNARKNIEKVNAWHDGYKKGYNAGYADAKNKKRNKYK